jgi:hypothetical protein
MRSLRTASQAHLESSLESTLLLISCPRASLTCSALGGELVHHYHEICPSIRRRDSTKPVQLVKFSWRRSLQQARTTCIFCRIASPVRQIELNLRPDSTTKAATLDHFQLLYRLLDTIPQDHSVLIYFSIVSMWGRVQVRFRVAKTRR